MAKKVDGLSRGGAREAIEVLQTSGLVDLDMPVKSLIAAVSKLDEVAGYALVWERYAVIVADVADLRGQPG